MDLYKGNMRWQKKECLLRKIKWQKKNQGQISVCMGMFFCMIVFLTILCQIKLLQYRAAGALVEDALAASNLASAVINVEEYGKTHNIFVESPEMAFFRYREALQYNMQLDTELQSREGCAVCGKVDILSYQIFQVAGDKVCIYRFNEEGRLMETLVQELSSAALPDGKAIEGTSIYSKVGFRVRGLGEEIIYAIKEKSVDIKGE